MSIILPTTAEIRHALGRPDRWPEATILREPLKEKALKATGPTLLVKRNVPELRSDNGDDLFYLPGHPTISLFTGAGGFDIGTERAGFVTLVQHEWADEACQTLIANRPDFFRHYALIQGDISKTPTSMILGAAGLRVGEAHLLTGGPPCQGFSTAGKRRVGDMRNTLVYEFLRVVREAQPHFFIMENVPGFLSMEDGKFFHGFLKLAYECYYELVYGLANAVEYGVPQDRCRFLCMGTRRDLFEIHGTLGSLQRPQCFAPQDLTAIEHLSRAPLFGDELNLLTHPPGIRYFPDREVLIPPRPTSAHGVNVESDEQDTMKGRSKSFVDFYRRLYREEPDRIVTQPIDGEEVA